MRRFLATTGFIMMATAAWGQTPAPDSAVTTGKASAEFINLDGKSIGQAELMETKGGVVIQMSVSGIPEGEHAFHIHQTGNCDTASKFESAGAHFTPGDQTHGYESSRGPHAGDMLNQFVGADGELQAHIINANVTLLDGASSLFDADGSALVLHADPDDYSSQPSGAAGDRIACAVIKKAE
ncbi:superoxide dismutase [Cu-Zn] [Agaricicola taiwanensis]|uniref:Superoxide dismutase [Cu-Zn] n=1 Tax=Agaricicola taiwanensis TaxID=591372 RepID=A0A8J2VNN4_9RHOB|nr:superoxide dismutase family protein [Agaricicola taiwanensis]GGE35267.1 superoxide dismutase [Cu-Zn] [Agaricicola taiwanensis]